MNFIHHKTESLECIKENKTCEKKEIVVNIKVLLNNPRLKRKSSFYGCLSDEYK